MTSTPSDPSYFEREALGLAQALGLAPHPEGGFFRETYRSASSTQTPLGPRSVGTCIYYLLAPGTFSALHRVKSDEIWHHYGGDPIDLHVLDDAGVYSMVTLGNNFYGGERPQWLVAANHWQAAVPRGPRFALCGCTVTPGFDFDDFEMAVREDLAGRFPQRRAMIEALTRV